MVFLGMARAETLKIFAASSLKESFEAVTAQYKQDNPADEVELNMGAVRC